MVRQAAANLDRPAMDMVSGAGHDSVYVSRVAPTGMIFIPCKDGLSHNEAESVTEADVTAGCNVLMGAVCLVLRMRALHRRCVDDLQVSICFVPIRFSRRPLRDAVRWW